MSGARSGAFVSAYVVDLARQAAQLVAPVKAVAIATSSPQVAVVPGICRWNLGLSEWLDVELAAPPPPYSHAKGFSPTVPAYLSFSGIRRCLLHILLHVTMCTVSRLYPLTSDRPSLTHLSSTNRVFQLHKHKVCCSAVREPR